MKRRNLVRLTSFVTAGYVLCGGLIYTGFHQAQTAKQQLEYTYAHSLEDLVGYMSNISVALQKELYTGSDTQIAALSSQLCREATAAKANLSRLPVNALRLENTYKFLSQVGNYSLSLANKAAAGEELTAEERENLRTLSGYARRLSHGLGQIQGYLDSGALTMEELNTAAAAVSLSGDAGEGFSPVSGFLEMEEGFSDYPTLIYDGPFSDHIMQKEPLMVKDAPNTTPARARETAAVLTGRAAEDLQPDTDEQGKLPAYCFTSGTLSAAITKQGGMPLYLLDARAAGTPEHTAKEAVKTASDWLKKRGFTQMQDSYYEIAGGVCTINFSYTENDVTYYTDLIKVGVALDNLDVVSFDARGYLVNHTHRTLPAPALERQEAAALLNPALTVLQSRLCLIPTMGMQEAFCYEFLCTDEAGQKVLVYIDTGTGAERELLILIENENGSLTL